MTTVTEADRGYWRKLGRFKIDARLASIRRGAADFESVGYVLTYGTSKDVAVVIEHVGDGFGAIAAEGLRSAMPEWERLHKLLGVVPVHHLPRLPMGL